MVDAGSLVFAPVWLILERPRPNVDPARFISPGRLVVDHQGLMFDSEIGASSLVFPLLFWPANQPQDVHLKVRRIVKVGRARYGWGLFPRFVAVTHELDGQEEVVYFNDAAWHGWRALLTGSNRRLAAALERRLAIG